MVRRRESGLDCVKVIRKIGVRLTACVASDLFRPRCIDSEKSPPCRMEMQKGAVRANHIVRLAGRVQVAREAFASCVPAVDCEAASLGPARDCWCRWAGI